jgi:aminomethyltransferase
MSGLLTSPIHDRHVALEARLADFAGWEMPIEYSGVIAEHTAVRERAGIFDVSHLGKATVSGPGAAEFVNGALTNDLSRIAPGKAQYTLCCDESGGVVDDLIAYLRGADEVLLVPNAANAAEVVRRLRAAAPDGLDVRDEHRSYGVLAVQGPRSADLLARLGLPVDGGYMSFATAVVGSAPVIICRTGYTGERGYELLPRWEETGAVWDALLEAGKEFGAVPCGLGARDTLRTEMGYPLHGHELTRDISPVQGGAGWAVGWKKEEFWGREALLAERAAGAPRTLWALESTDRGIPRPGMAVSAAGEPVGTVTSGTFSPTLRRGIGLALIDTVAGLTEGAEVAVDVRGRESVMRLARPPLVPSHVR